MRTPRKRSAEIDVSSLYRLRESKGTSCGTADISLHPLDAGWRRRIAKSRKRIRVGDVERLRHGTLKCTLRTLRGLTVGTKEEKPRSVRVKAAVVGLYKGRKVVGKELICVPTPEELETGIPEWRFDLQHTSIFGTAWDFSSTDVWIWTVRGLRKDGKLTACKNLG